MIFQSCQKTFNLLLSKGLKECIKKILNSQQKHNVVGTQKIRLSETQKHMLKIIDMKMFDFSLKNCVYLNLW